MKTRKNLINKLLIINIFVIILFSIPVTRLDLLSENYSTLSLNIKGYLFLLLLGIITGLLFYFETKLISNNKRAIVVLCSMILGTIVPHHIPYNLQGNLHLLFAYIGFEGLIIVTILNIFCYRKLLNFYMIIILTAILIFLKVGMVNTISEVLVMYASIIVNYKATKIILPFK